MPRALNVSTGVQAVVVPLLYDLAIRATVIRDSITRILPKPLGSLPIIVSFTMAEPLTQWLSQGRAGSVG
jgi:hypothetical protein